MATDPAFHFFTLVTKDDQYARMRASLGEVGFDESNSVFTVLDNRAGNAHEPYSAITAAVRDAEAPYVVFCHQDLVFQQGPGELLARLKELEAIDPNWAVAGNTGWTPRQEVAVCIDDPSGSHWTYNYPALVLTLDENLLVIKRGSGVGCSPEMSGFHLYATDLCLNAYLKGRSAYVVDYRVTHLTGALDYTGLHRLARRFRQVWRKRIRSALLITPSMILVISRVPLIFTALNRPGLYARLALRSRVMSTLDYLLRHDRPEWLPAGEVGDDDDEDFRRPRLNLAVRTLDRLLRLRR